MKKIFFLFFILPFLTGCNKEVETLPEPSPVGGILSVRSQAALPDGPQGAAEIPGKAATRAAGDIALTYTFEAWTRDAEPRCVLHKTADGTLTEAAIGIMLVPGSYDFLFWADYGKGHYTTDNLRQVSLAGVQYVPGNDRDAFAGKLEDVQWNGGNGVSATLKRPLAMLTMRNRTPFTEAKAVSVQYRGIPARYDVLTGGTAAPQTITPAFPDTEAGSDAVGEDFLFVPSDGRGAALVMTVDGVTRTLDPLELGPNCKTSVTATFE